MANFPSHNGTKRPAIVPFGWTEGDSLIHDDIAAQERARVQEEARSFGRRVIPPRGKRAPKLEEKRFTSLAGPKPKETTLSRHPRDLISRKPFQNMPVRSRQGARLIKGQQTVRRLRATFPASPVQEMQMRISAIILGCSLALMPAIVPIPAAHA